MPWRRIYQGIKSNRIDGFFTAIPMRQLDSYGVLSSPLILENWYWFWRADTVAPDSWQEGYKLGSILGSQQEAWLSDAKYSVEMSANNLPQLIKLLRSKRVDAILADRERFLQTIDELGVDAHHFQSRFFRYVPLGVYFNEKFLQRNPDFLSDFNRHIARCSTVNFVITDYEKLRVQELLGHKIEQWVRLSALESTLLAVNKQSKNLTMQELMRRDEKWMRAFAENDHNYPLALMDRSMSEELRNIKSQSQGVITEVIVTDNRGLNVAVSDITSDYWQGDEDSFIQCHAKPAGSLCFGNINYDESTKRFQLHLSMPLYPTRKGNALGVMIVGVDVEKVLSQIQ